MYYNFDMYEIEHTDEFEDWWDSLELYMQEDLAHSIGVLEEIGPSLGRPHADTVEGSEFTNMKELRTQSKGQPIRTFFVFDPRRKAILLIGGIKNNEKVFYNRMIPIADKLYIQHLKEIENE